MPLQRRRLRAWSAADQAVFHALNYLEASSPHVSRGIGTLTEGRTSTIYLPNDAGIWQPFGSGVPGKVYAGGKWWLYGGPAGTNEITFSRDLTNPAWTETGTDVAVLDAVGLRGEANGATTLTDNDGGATEYLTEETAISDDLNPIVLRVWVRRDMDESRFPAIRVQTSGGTAVRRGIRINTKTGAATIWQTAGQGSHEVNLNGDWWEVLVQITNNATGNTSVDIYLASARGNTIGTDDVSATGSIIVGNVELHLNKTIAQVRGSTPIFTAGSTVSVNASDLSFDDANHSDAEGAYYCEIKNVGLDVNNVGGLLGMGSAGRLFFTDSGADNFRSFDATTQAIGPAITLAADDVEYKVGLAYGSSSQRINTDGSWGTAVAYDGGYNNSIAKINVLHNETTVSAPLSVMLLRNLRRYALPNTGPAQAQIDELMAL